MNGRQSTDSESDIKNSPSLTLEPNSIILIECECNTYITSKYKQSEKRKQQPKIQKYRFVYIE